MDGQAGYRLDSSLTAPQHEEPVLGEHRQERGERVVEQVKDEERAAGNSFR